MVGEGLGSKYLDPSLFPPHPLPACYYLVGTNYRQLGRKTKAPKAHRSSLEYIYSHIVDQIRIHSAAIDVFIQQQPSITAVVWGSVRLILQTVIDKEEASKIAGQGILEILGQIDRWSTAATIFATNSRVQDVVVKLYVETLGFLALAKEHLGLSGLQRFGESVIGSKREKLHSKLRSLKSAAKLLDLEVTTEFHRHYCMSCNLCTALIPIPHDRAVNGIVATT
ncbi:hypothetical protein B0H63DRAFT_179619 [Podospora didyma]|uniref:DUF7708 domain-containing protein n=1 Tax=Podospora didyma TaxID=330526 RepID=A0AAE0NPI7_9PEZI|nr:hypothetical protein B0H63DRAFT_179619 [Podospora didyma]